MGSGLVEYDAVFKFGKGPDLIACSVPVFSYLCSEIQQLCGEEAAEEGVEIWRSEKAPLATPPAPTH